MSIHLRAINDFPQDCNPHEADLLRRELAYYIYRRIGRTRITVHLEGYSPTVPYAQRSPGDPFGALLFTSHPSASSLPCFFPLSRTLHACQNRLPAPSFSPFATSWWSELIT